MQFNNHQVELYGKVAHAMGDYIFTDATSGDKVRNPGPTPTPTPDPTPTPTPNPTPNKGARRVHLLL